MKSLKNAMMQFVSYNSYLRVIAVLLLILIPCFNTFAADYTPPSVVSILDTASKKDVTEAIAYLKSSAASLTVPAEKRLVISYLASLQEQLGLFTEASSSYATAASLPGNASYGKSQLSSEQLVLNAVRASLSAGDTVTADAYMASAVQNSKNENTTSQLRLYTVWSRLCKAQTVDDLAEPIVILSSYADMNSMNSVRAAVLLTLWYLTGDSEYAKTLKRDFPDSAETAVTNGNALLLPAPFWFFIPKSESALASTENSVTTNTSLTVDTPVVSKTVTSTTSTSPNVEETTSTSASSSNTAVKQQLGLFRDEENAQRLSDKLKLKGFSAQITAEKRASGTVYYIVTVAEDSDMTVGMQLKNAGFECYPVYPD